IASSLQDLADDNNLWKANSAQRRAQAVVQEFSFFAEDTWRLTSSLTASYGLRWEISPAPQPAAANFLDPLSGDLESVDRPIWRATYGNLAPRFGIAYRPSKSGRTVIRAGAGVYLDSSLSLATDLVNDGPLNVSLYKSARHAPFSTVL